MSHERRTELHDITIFVDCCSNCPHYEEKKVFRSKIDEIFDKHVAMCSLNDTELKNLKHIPIECPLPPRYKK